MIPFGGSFYYTDAGEAKRQAINHWVRTTKAFDAVIDADAAVRDPANPGAIRAAYDSGDHLHPGDAGYQAIADAVDLNVFRGRVGTLTGATPGQSNAGRCVRRRSISIRLRAGRHRHLRAVRIYAGGRLVRVLKGGQLPARVRLTPPAKGNSFRVRIVRVTATGRRLVERRYYRQCA